MHLTANIVVLISILDGTRYSFYWKGGKDIVLGTSVDLSCN